MRARELLATLVVTVACSGQTSHAMAGRDSGTDATAPGAGGIPGSGGRTGAGGAGGFSGTPSSGNGGGHTIDAGAGGATPRDGATTDDGGGAAPASRGAAVPYFEYEAESATTNGVVIGPSRTFGEMAAEASGRRAVRLEAAGQHVDFEVQHPANSIVLRYAIPDAPAGGGATATLGLYVNGARKSLQLTSRYSWTYGDADAQGQGSEAPSAGTPHHFYDEVHARFDEVPSGATLSLRRDAEDTAAFYVVDLIDLEEVGAPLARPDGALSITDYGATPDDASDDGPAIQRAVDAAAAQKKTLFVPPGTYESTTAPLSVHGVTIRGAGMWYSTIQGYFAQFKVSGSDNRFADFALFGDVTYRDDAKGDSGFDGPAGAGSRLDDVWIEHVKAGWWVGRGSQPTPITAPLTDGLVIHGARIRDTYADGVNFANATKNSVVEESHFRNTGDDAIATWSFAMDGPLPCEGNVFRSNTVQTVWRANCVAVYGGKNNHVENDTCTDTSNYPGILVSTTFGAIAFSGATVVKESTVTRGGGPHYGQELGALRIFADTAPVTNVTVEGVSVEDATFSGLDFAGSQAITGVVLDGVTISGAGTNGIWLRSGATGMASANGVTVSNAKGAALKDDATGAFMLVKGTGNSGW